MKNTTFITSTLMLILVSFQLAAQEASRFPILPTSVWRINYEYKCEGEVFSHENGDQEYKYFVNGDTLINGRTYFKLYKTGIMYLDTPVPVTNKYMGAIRDSANRFFWVEEKQPTEHLLYNFDVKVGEPLCPECDGIDYIVSEIDTLDNGRKRFYIDVMTVHCGSANRLIEGIGWLGGLLEGNACYSHPGVRGSYLQCYSENGIPVYETEESPRCSKKMSCDDDFTSIDLPLVSGTPELTLLNNHLLEICLSDGSGGQYDIELFTLQGKKVYQQSADLPATIDVAGIGSGPFLISISNNQMGHTLKFVIQ